MNAKDNVLMQLNKLGENNLKAELEKKSYSNFSYKILLLFFKDFEMLFTFICGLITNLPVSILFNLLTFKEVDYHNFIWVLYFVIYILCLISAIIFTALSFAVTIKYVHIKSGNTVPMRIRICIETKSKETTPLRYILRCSFGIIISGLFCILAIIALFIFNAFLLG